MKSSDLKLNCTVKICTDYVTNDPDKKKEILERVAKIISKSYRKEGVQ